MKKVLIFSDLDGTALNEKHEFSQKLIETVDKIYSLNSYFVPITARSTKDALIQAKKLKLDKLGGLIAANNGAQIFDFKQNRFIVDKRLSSDFIRNIFNFTYGNFKYKVHYFADDTTYVYGKGDNSSFWSKIMDVEYKIVQSLNEIVKPISHLTIILEKQATDEQADKFYNGFKKYYPDVEIIKYTTRVFEVAPKGINKGFAVTEIINYLQVKNYVSYAFGDSHNDFDLFAKVDISIAMENAMPQLIEISAETTDRNDQDGVAKFINKKILIDYI
ncbi:HAD family hydrolase [Spiroplasma endosymbiont of Labia minor]|uniref:HAD family hydrolase n=1 Tax=Spiroplasma endosymbiont of Labia minor TaxID=3066305 RepID=UPI0030CCD242